jgi:transcriptional regulator with XRE-family HTH domain
MPQKNINVEEIIAALPPERRAKILARGRQLIAKEKALRHLRQARNLTQKSMATLLGMDQAGVSKIEHRSDMLLSTLRSYVEAMGGSLRLLAEFPDGAAELLSLNDDDVPERPAASGVVKAQRGPQLVHADD